MTTKREELITALITGLKIEEDVYAIETVKESTEFLNEAQYLDFYQEVMKEDTFGNGVKAVLKIADKFKPQIVITDEVEAKAKELIKLAHDMNAQIFRDSEHMEVTFDDLLQVVEFPTTCKADIAILDNVKPYNSHKLLIGNINAYATSIEQLQAFIGAIKQSTTETLEISGDVKKMIGR